MKYLFISYQYLSFRNFIVILYIPLMNDRNIRITYQFITLVNGNWGGGEVAAIMTPLICNWSRFWIKQLLNRFSGFYRFITVNPLKTAIFINASGRRIFNSINLKFCVKAYIYKWKTIFFLFSRRLAVNGITAVSKIKPSKIIQFLQGKICCTNI